MWGDESDPNALYPADLSCPSKHSWMWGDETDFYEIGMEAGT